MRRKTLIQAGLLLLLLASSAVPCSAGGGKPVYEFLRVPMSARAAGLGNTFLGARNDPAALFFNPGSLSSLEHPAASVGFVKYLMDINAGYAVYGQNVDGLGWVGGGIVYMNYGEFQETDKFGNNLGSFGVHDLAFTAAYGNHHENIHYGAAVKFIYSGIADYSSTGLALDAGVSWNIPEQDIVLGFSILNLGTQLDPYASTREDLPLDVKIGVSKKLEHLPLTLGLDFHKLNEAQDNLIDHLSAFSIGGEFALSPNFRARVGYNNEMRRELKIGESAKLAGLSAGVGITVAGYLVDYAFNSFGEIGSLHRFSLSASF